MNGQPEDLRTEILDILQWYGEQFDPQGWAVDERLEAADKLLVLCEAAALAALPEKELDGVFNLKLQKILTDYGMEFTPKLDGNDLYNVASDIWDAHCQALATAQANIHSVFGGKFDE